MRAEHLVLQLHNMLIICHNVAQAIHYLSFVVNSFLIFKNVFFYPLQNVLFSLWPYTMFSDCLETKKQTLWDPFITYHVKTSVLWKLGNSHMAISVHNCFIIHHYINITIDKGDSETCGSKESYGGRKHVHHQLITSKISQISGYKESLLLKSLTLCKCVHTFSTKSHCELCLLLFTYNGQQWIGGWNSVIWSIIF